MKKYSFALILMLGLSVQLFHSSKLLAQTTTAPQPADLKPFVGKYQFTDNNRVFLQIMLKDGQLVLKQLWDNQEISFK